jgi:hypothetical protein
MTMSALLSGKAHRVKPTREAALGSRIDKNGSYFRAGPDMHWVDEPAGQWLLDIERGVRGCDGDVERRNPTERRRGMLTQDWRRTVYPRQHGAGVSQDLRDPK